MWSFLSYPYIFVLRTYDSDVKVEVVTYYGTYTQPPTSSYSDYGICAVGIRHAGINFV